MSTALLILVVMVAVSLAGLYASPRIIEKSLFRPYWFLRSRQYETIVTSGFVHADLPHLLFNAFTFFFFAFQVERQVGSARFAALYLFGLVASDIGTYFNHRDDQNYASLGASGAISAVLFASIVYFPWQKLIILPIPIPIPGAAVRDRLRCILVVRGSPGPRSHQPRCASRRSAGGSRVRAVHRSWCLFEPAQVNLGLSVVSAGLPARAPVGRLRDHDPEGPGRRDISGLAALVPQPVRCRRGPRRDSCPRV